MLDAALPDGSADEERAHPLHIGRGLHGASHGLDEYGERREFLSDERDHEVVVRFI